MCLSLPFFAASFCAGWKIKIKKPSPSTRSISLSSFASLVVKKSGFLHPGPDIAVVSDQVVTKVDVFLGDRKRRADVDPATGPFDDLRNYAYEGCGSTAGSLSSLQSGKSRKSSTIINPQPSQPNPKAKTKTITFLQPPESITIVS